MKSIDSKLIEITSIEVVYSKLFVYSILFDDKNCYIRSIKMGLN